jgi:hypothetical protein
VLLGEKRERKKNNTQRQIIADLFFRQKCFFFSTIRALSIGLELLLLVKDVYVSN